MLKWKKIIILTWLKIINNFLLQRLKFSVFNYCTKIINQSILIYKVCPFGCKFINISLDMKCEEVTI